MTKELFETIKNGKNIWYNYNCKNGCYMVLKDAPEWFAACFDDYMEVYDKQKNSKDIFNIVL